MCSSAGLSPVAETGLEAPAGVPATGKQDRGTAGPALPRACRQERPGSLQGALPGPTLAPLCRMSLLSRHRTSAGTWTSSVGRGGGEGASFVLVIIANVPIRELAPHACDWSPDLSAPTALHTSVDLPLWSTNKPPR